MLRNVWTIIKVIHYILMKVDFLNDERALLFRCPHCGDVITRTWFSTEKYPKSLCNPCEAGWYKEGYVNDAEPTIN